MNRTMTSRWADDGLPVLDEEAWEAPAGLTAGQCAAELGADAGRRSDPGRGGEDDR